MLQKEIQEHEEENAKGNSTQAFRDSHRVMQAQHTQPESPYMINVPMQIRMCTTRAYQCLWNDKVSTVTTVIGQVVMALIIGLVFYATPNTTADFAKGSILFFAILLNALISVSEISSLHSQRLIVEKQVSYAFYHPWTEAMAGIVSDVPVTFLVAVCFNIILYFLTGLRTEPSQFFIFFLCVHLYPDRFCNFSDTRSID